MSSSVALTPAAGSGAKIPSIPGHQVEDVIVVFGAYLDGASAVASVRVCRTWRNHLNDQAAHAKEDEYCRRVGYRPELVQALRSRNLSLWRLPVLDLGQRMGHTGYIDFLRSNDVTSPLMRFADKFGRVGLAVRLRGNADGNIEWFDQQRPIREASTVLAVFQRYASGNKWVPGGSGGGLISGICDKVHRPHHQHESMGEACPTCPPFTMGDAMGFTLAVITKTDPAMKIDGEIQQVTVPALLPPMPPKPVVEQPPAAPAAAANAPVSFPRRIWNAVSGFFLWIASLFSRLVSYCRGQ